MSTTNYPITETTDGQGNLVWIVNGETFNTEKEAIERQRQLEDQLPMPPRHSDDVDPDDEEPTVTPAPI